MSDLSMGIQKHRDFVDRLINDDDFRNHFAENPTAVLQEHGIGYDPSSTHTTGEAPSAEALRAARDGIVKKLDSGAGWDALNPANWDTNNNT